MHLSLGRTTALVAVSLLAGGASNCVSASVVVIANRTQSAIRFDVAPPARGAAKSRTVNDASDEKTRRPIFLDLSGKSRMREGHLIEAGDCIAIPFESSGPLSIRGRDFGGYELRPYGVYYFGSARGGKIELREIGLQTPPARQAAARPPLIGAQADLGDAAAIERDGKRDDARDDNRDSRRTINLAVYVDDEENAVEHVWQKRLLDRVAAASTILERTCSMKLAVKSFGRWESNDADTEFTLALREFERSVKPGDAHVAVGFTSQYTITRGRTHLGGTHGPLHSHILLREWSQHVSEPERLEMLVHELGHFLGAVHSPEANSVMRPILGDRQARARAFRIAFDPVNALAMSIVGEEIRDRGMSSFGQLSDPSRARLEGVYSTIAQALPDDPAAASYLLYLRRRFRIE